MEDNCPGNFHQEVDYVTIAGKFIKGAKLRDGSASNAQKIAGAGYQQVCGEADVWGDGIVPLASAHLEGELEDSMHPAGIALHMLLFLHEQAYSQRSHSGCQGRFMCTVLLEAKTKVS